MLAEEAIRERVKYCYLVYRQLEWLYSNPRVAPVDYIERIRSSSLQLGDDGFIMGRMEEALRFGEGEEALRDLLSFYEGMVFAMAAVLTLEISDIENLFPRETLTKMAGEMGVDHK